VENKSTAIKVAVSSALRVHMLNGTLNPADLNPTNNLFDTGLFQSNNNRGGQGDVNNMDRTGGGAVSRRSTVRTPNPRV
jgi:hypothetical protein